MSEVLGLDASGLHSVVVWLPVVKVVAKGPTGASFGLSLSTLKVRARDLVDKRKISPSTRLQLLTRETRLIPFVYVLIFSSEATGCTSIPDMAEATTNPAGPFSCFYLPHLF